MRYLTRLSAGAMDQPMQAERKPPVQATPAAVQTDTPVEPAGVAAKVPPEADAAPAVQEPKVEAVPAPKEAPKEVQRVGATPVEPIKLDSPTPDDAAARQAHEAAEAKRKAEWDARQAEKKAAEQAALDKLAAMSDADVIRESTKHIGDATEKITRRNMKEQVAEHVQTLCQSDPAFARKAMHPRKGMVNCFRYISRKAYEYVQDELKASGIKPGPGSEGYGCDVPDGLCFQWTEYYFNDPDAEEDKPKEKQFVPKPYIPPAKTKTQSAAKKGGAKKKQIADKKPPDAKDDADTGQITFGGFSAKEEKAG